MCVSVCPAFTAYILLTMGRILIKLGENVGTLVQLIVLKLFQSISSQLRHTFFFKFSQAQNVRKRHEQDVSANMLRQTVTLAQETESQDRNHSRWNFWTEP